MKEGELELKIVCMGCGYHFKRFKDMMTYHVPMSMFVKGKIRRSAYLKCPCCFHNHFIIKVLKDNDGEYR